MSSERISDLGRMGKFALAYCGAGFATHHQDVAQIRRARRTAE